MNPWVISYTITTTLSLIGQIAIMVLYFIQKGSLPSNASQDLLFRMAISDSIFSIGQLQMIFPNNREQEEIMTRCVIYSFFLQFGTLSLCFNCFCLCFFSYQSFTYTQKTIKKYANWSIIFCFGLPFVIASYIVSLRDTESGEYTCFMTGLDKGQGAIQFFTLFYVPLMFFMFLSLLYDIKAYIYVKEFKKYNGSNLELEAAQEILSNMMLYPVVFFISWSGYIIERINFMITKDEGVFRAEGLLVTLNDSQGMLNSSIYIFNYFRTKKLVDNFMRNNNQTGGIRETFITQTESSSTQQELTPSVPSLAS